MSKAIFTICRTEPQWLPIWLDYYSRYFTSEDIYVINHVDHSDFDQYVDTLKNRCQIDHLVYDETYDHEWLRGVVQIKQKNLLKQYSTVVFAEIDEILWHRDGLDHFIDNMKVDLARARGLEIVHHYDEEPPIDLSKPLLRQRKWCYDSKIYCKTLISKVVCQWCHGFHFCENHPVEVNPDLYLIHLHKLDWDLCVQRNRLHKHTIAPVPGQAGEQNIRQEEEWLRDWWWNNVDGFPSKVKAEHFPIPEEILDAI